MADNPLLSWLPGMGPRQNSLLDNAPMYYPPEARTASPEYVPPMRSVADMRAQVPSDMAGGTLAGRTVQGFGQSPATVGSVTPAMARAITEAERTKFMRTRDPTQAKYVLPDGRLLGAGDNDHQYIANGLGFGKPGSDESIWEMLRETGAVRVNAAQAIFGEGAAMQMHHPPTAAQRAVLARIVKQNNSPTGIEFGQHYGEVSNGGEMARYLEAPGEWGR